MLIFNDNFGTLACALHAHRPYSVSDSYMSQLATRHNLKLNGLDPEQVTLLDSLAELPAAPAVVLIRVPKALALLEQQLRALRHVVTEDTLIVAGAKARDVHTSTMQLFEKSAGPNAHQPGMEEGAPDLLPGGGHRSAGGGGKPPTWALDGTDWLIHNHANVFSARQPGYRRAPVY
ncbi:Ribosomal RNA large subunit methyltransferase G [Serratia marcescens]|uniref:Ribosomal RNA large subunit methyltransferase G n=1 Tax=Serratia marcescens TaxID=615 RepID=A0A379YG43_SERMA|nr:Ribosomal RNA large subunit methyltransferase G [Serratia marcescens]